MAGEYNDSKKTRKEVFDIVKGIYLHEDWKELPHKSGLVLDGTNLKVQYSIDNSGEKDRVYIRYLNSEERGIAEHLFDHFRHLSKGKYETHLERGSSETRYNDETPEFESVE
ncbi:MAG: hypothetical protein ACOCUU_03340 [Nanoarchaeota archaeon]